MCTDDDLVVPHLYGAGNQGQGSPAARRRASVQCHHQGSAGDTRVHYRIRYGGKTPQLHSLATSTNPIVIRLTITRSVPSSRRTDCTTSNQFSRSKRAQEWISQWVLDEVCGLLRNVDTAS